MFGKTSFEKKSFYWWGFHTPGSSFWSYFVVAVVIFFLLFPIWPFSMKVISFYMSLYSLIFLVGFIVVRLVSYCILRILGIEFWIMPDLFIADSFVPYYTFCFVSDGVLGWLFRLFCKFNVDF